MENQDTFEKVLVVLNEMQQKGIVKTYAIGGGHAAIVYGESFFTEDVDVFVVVQVDRENSIDYLADINAYLTKHKGYSFQGPYIRIEGILVQFLPASDPPYREAVEQAIEIPFGQTTMRLISAEHLVALMVLAGRPKDFIRINNILENKVDFDKNKLNDIIKRNGLTEKWARFEKSRQ